MSYLMDMPVFFALIFIRDMTLFNARNKNAGLI
jgi:hypothetical protein